MKVKRVQLTFDEAGKSFKNNPTENNFNILFKLVNKPLKHFISKFFEEPGHYVEEINEIFVLTMTKVYNKIGQYNAEYNFGTWLYTIAKNQSHENFYKRTRDVTMPNFEEAMLRVKPSTVNYNYFGVAMDDLIEYSEYDKVTNYIEEDRKLTRINEQIIDEMEVLPDLYKEIIKDRLVDDMSYDEIATKHNVKMDTVKNRIFHGKKIIRRKVEALD